MPDACRQHYAGVGCMYLSPANPGAPCRAGIPSKQADESVCAGRCSQHPTWMGCSGATLSLTNRITYHAGVTRRGGRT
jgi:hypothetical protein